MTTDIVILAAGQGSRMKSSLPKVLHAVAGKPMVKHVLDQARNIKGASVHVVIGHGAELLQGALSEERVTFTLQEQQLGTGHAVAQALPNVDPEGVTLILYGDVPLTRVDTMQQLVSSAVAGHLGLLTVHLQQPAGYGRIIRNATNDVIAIVEQKDASAAQLLITEVNTGIMAVPTHLLLKWLPLLSANNAQGEYYLTDIIAMAAEQGISIETQHPACEQEVQGVNNRVQLAELERWYQLQQAQLLMLDGATLADPSRVDIRGKVTVAGDVIIDINVVFEGDVVLERGVVIEPNCIIKNSVIGENSRIKANTIIEESTIGACCDVGPFARIRPGTQMASGAKVGNFVETKKAIIGEGSKISHLSYVGDAIIGKNTNIGAGTITCNYDGVNKSLTDIGDNVFIGSNTSLVAPVKVGSGATVGAGSTITKEVADSHLAVARGKQTNLSNWQRPVKKS
ncbi:bifunctional UDP-N-acetylglucosamine diphosphorylase/glucosamine-1-phosphate N-acetyltransferase GlmU [Neptunomonas antarctica]|uniref:Bifunctional protein GlmU n=1 Tax=Neptunomonas antarctica TaxID=619304 RepID=A0A1N7ISB5_9GAMM|nr:bifunctional UDP-N-acetylglucosamine diphosphorylase/glucosamine-1-phosphate N-acetyltransferase GlmU [Neptunomonas antarctica]SIS39999.1 UDP-N-acetylglucosamine pyrophosphorylase /glucosamine-1-phosphate N-acetyltransferase [Neptunomonas antarctica]